MLFHVLDSGAPQNPLVGCKALLVRLVIASGLVALTLLSIQRQHPSDVTELVTKLQTTREAVNGSLPITSRKRNKPAAAAVAWIRDDDWYHEQSKRGCCPYPAIIYEHRFAHINFRCCDYRFDEMDPLRPVGGLSFTNMNSSALSHTTSLLQGDSLMEQQFLSLLCLAWRQDVPVNLSLEWSVDGDLDHTKPGTTWKAVIGNNDESTIHNMTIRYLRLNTPEFYPTTDYSAHDFVLLGGWHHGKLELVDSFLTNMTHHRTQQPTIVVEALPNHFPGGEHSKTNDYPPTNGTSGLCDKTNYRADPPINNQLRRKVRSYKQQHNLLLLEAQALYINRGEAHIGSLGTGLAGVNGRDCLHYCFAPGVLDALALQTMAFMAAVVRR